MVQRQNEIEVGMMSGEKLFKQSFAILIGFSGVALGIGIAGGIIEYGANTVADIGAISSLAILDLMIFLVAIAIWRMK